MLFLERRKGQSVLVTTPDGKKLIISIIGETIDGGIRMGFDGLKDEFKIVRLYNGSRARSGLKKQKAQEDQEEQEGIAHATSKYPSDHGSGDK